MADTSADSSGLSMRRDSGVSAADSAASVGGLLVSSPPLRPLSPVTRLSTRERLTLSTWEKWWHYGRFPWKLVLHVLLLVCVSAQLILFNEQDAAYFRASRRNFAYYLFPADFDFSSPEYYLYSVNDTVRAIQTALVNFETILDTSIDFLNYTEEFGARGTLQVRRYASRNLFNPDGSFSSKTEDEEFVVTSRDMGPFDMRMNSYHDVQAYVQHLVDMSLTFHLVSFGFASLRRTCLVWRVQLEYSFRSRGQIVLHLRSNVLRNCNPRLTAKSIWSGRLLWLNLVVIALATALSGLVLRSVMWSLHVVRRTARRRRVESWRSWFDTIMVGLRHTLTRWVLVTLSACACAVVHAILDLSQNSAHAPSDSGHKLAAGLAVFLLWFNVVAYFAHNPNYYTLVLTLDRSIPRVLRFLVGALPVLLGYTLFGMLYFGDHTERFGSFQNSIITLFAVLNGDVIRETYMDILPYSPVVAQVYMFTFLFLFIYVVLNIIVALVEEAFFSTKLAAEQARERRQRGSGRSAAGTRSRRASGTGGIRIGGADEAGGGRGVAPADVASERRAVSIPRSISGGVLRESMGTAAAEEAAGRHREMRDGSLWFWNTVGELDEEDEERFLAESLRSSLPPSVTTTPVANSVLSQPSVLTNFPGLSSWGGRREGSGGRGTSAQPETAAGRAPSGSRSWRADSETSGEGGSEAG